MNIGIIGIGAIGGTIAKKLVKAGHTVKVANSRGKGAEGRLAMQVAGDDAEQKKVVMELVDACGFDPFDAGTLEDSWKMQPTAAGYCCDYTLEELKAVKEKSDQTPEAVAKRRTYVMTHFNELTGGDFSHENVIRMNRKINV